MISLNDIDQTSLEVLVQSIKGLTKEVCFEDIKHVALKSDIYLLAKVTNKINRIINNSETPLSKELTERIIRDILKKISPHNLSVDSFILTDSYKTIDSYVDSVFNLYTNINVRMKNHELAEKMLSNFIKRLDNFYERKFSKFNEVYDALYNELVSISLNENIAKSDIVKISNKCASIFFDSTKEKINGVKNIMEELKDIIVDKIEKEYLKENYNKEELDKILAEVADFNFKDLLVRCASLANISYDSLKQNLSLYKGKSIGELVRDKDIQVSLEDSELFTKYKNFKLHLSLVDLEYVLFNNMSILSAQPVTYLKILDAMNKNINECFNTNEINYELINNRNFNYVNNITCSDINEKLKPVMSLLSVVMSKKNIVRYLKNDLSILTLSIDEIKDKFLNIIDRSNNEKEFAKNVSMLFSNGFYKESNVKKSEKSEVCEKRKRIRSKEKIDIDLKVNFDEIINIINNFSKNATTIYTNDEDKKEIQEEIKQSSEERRGLYYSEIIKCANQLKEQVDALNPVEVSIEDDLIYQIALEDAITFNKVKERVLDKIDILRNRIVMFEELDDSYNFYPAEKIMNEIEDYFDYHTQDISIVIENEIERYQKELDEISNRVRDKLVLTSEDKKKAEEKIKSFNISLKDSSSTIEKLKKKLEQITQELEIQDAIQDNNSTCIKDIKEHCSCLTCPEIKSEITEKYNDLLFFVEEKGYGREIADEIIEVYNYIYERLDYDFDYKCKELDDMFDKKHKQVAFNIESLIKKIKEQNKEFIVRKIDFSVIFSTCKEGYATLFNMELPYSEEKIIANHQEKFFIDKMVKVLNDQLDLNDLKCKEKKAEELEILEMDLVKAKADLKHNLRVIQNEKNFMAKGYTVKDKEHTEKLIEELEKSALKFKGTVEKVKKLIDPNNSITQEEKERLTQESQKKEKYLSRTKELKSKIFKPNNNVIEV